MVADVGQEQGLCLPNRREGVGLCAWEVQWGTDVQVRKEIERLEADNKQVEHISFVCYPFPFSLVPRHTSDICKFESRMVLLCGAARLTDG